MEFNDCLGADVIYLPLPGDKQKSRPALNLIDWATKFQLMIPVTSKKPDEIREAYRQWIRVFGPPKRIALDMWKEFRRAFAIRAEDDGSFVDPSAVEAPFQRGITERHAKTLKYMLLKAMDTYSCEDMQQWEQLLDEVVMTKNRLLQHNGFSPMQRVFGFSTRLPGGLLSGDDGNRALPDRARMGDLSVERSMRMRKAAAQAFVEADADAALRRYQLGTETYGGIRDRGDGLLLSKGVRQGFEILSSVLVWTSTSHDGGPAEYPMAVVSRIPSEGRSRKGQEGKSGGKPFPARMAEVSSPVQRRCLYSTQTRIHRPG